MPTPDPPTPTHLDMHGELNAWLDSRQTRAWRRYVENSESTAADLLKARERIAELEATIVRAQSHLPGPANPFLELFDRDIETVARSMSMAGERIAELERENAELTARLYESEPSE